MVTTKEKVETILGFQRSSVARLAREIGESKQTVSYWLEKPDAPRDDMAWVKIAGKLGVPEDILLDDEKPLPSWVLTGNAPPDRSRLPITEGLLTMLLDVLESKDESPEKKMVARGTIELWLSDFLH